MAEAFEKCLSYICPNKIRTTTCKEVWRVGLKTPPRTMIEWDRGSKYFDKSKWMRQGELNRRIECLTCAAQERAIWTIMLISNIKTVQRKIRKCYLQFPCLFKPRKETLKKNTWSSTNEDPYFSMQKAWFWM